MSKWFAIAAVWIAIGGLHAAQQPVFRSTTRTVVLYATVQGADERLAPGLPRDAFTVLDNGRPVDITVFSNDPQVLTVALLIDMSDSMVRHFLRVRAATAAFIGALQPGDRLRIGTFGEEVALSPHLTGDKALLTRVLEEETWPGGATPMWSAARAAMISLAGEPGRRVVVVLTDGADNGEKLGFEGSSLEVERRSIDDDFMVYAIGMEGTGVEQPLRYLTRESGGGNFELKAGDDLQATFARVIEELRHQYVLGFTPSALDGRRHRLDVRVTTPGMKVRARRNYLATPDGVRQP